VRLPISPHPHFVISGGAKLSVYVKPANLCKLGQCLSLMQIKYFGDMKLCLLAIASIVLFTACFNQKKFLKTGWYGISPERNLYQRIEAKTSDSFFVNPNPILTVRDFESVTIRDAKSGYMSEMLFKLNNNVSEKWEKETGRYIGEKIGFVLNNKLIQVLKVNEPLYGGFTMISGFPATELELIKKQVERGLKKK
jgi:hypothetical protein